jgi:ABC-type transporter Mla subunit MlaD
MSTSSPSGPAPKRKRASMFDIQPGQFKPNRVRTGAFFCAFIGLFLYIIYTKPSIPFLSSGGTTFKADFAYAADIRPGYTPVRIYGVDVGQVTNIVRGPSGRGAEVTMQFDSGQGIPLHSDATVQLRWRTLLGRNYYVDVLPGSPSAPLLGGGVIPESQTNSQVELDQVLEPLNATGRTALRTMFDQFDIGFSNPAAVHGTLSNFGPAMKNLGQGLPGLVGETPTDLAHLITYTSKTAGALAADEVNLGNLVTSGATALGVTGARAADIGSTFSLAPGALQNTQATMVRLRTTLNTLDPVARSLIPGAQKLAAAADAARTALNNATPLLRDAKPTLAALKPSLTALSGAATSGVPVVQSLSNTFNRVKTQFIPFLNTKEPDTKLLNYEAVGPLASAADSVFSWGDQNSVVATFGAIVGENTVGLTPCVTNLTNPGLSATQLVDCTALTTMLQSIFGGTPPAKTPLAPGSQVSLSAVRNLLLHGTGAPKKR